MDFSHFIYRTSVNSTDDTQEDRERETNCWKRGEGGGGRSHIIDGVKACPLKISESFNTPWLENRWLLVLSGKMSSLHELIYSKCLLLKIAGSYPLETKEAVPHTRNLGGNGKKPVSDLHTHKK
jgi:hypothetical protein